LLEPRAAFLKVLINVVKPSSQ